MRAFLDNMLGQIREFFSKMSKKDKIRLAILAVIVIILAIVVVSLLSRTNYVTLYTAESLQEAGTIYEALVEMGEPARSEGTRILVPEGKESELRIRLAAQGTINSNQITYDILNSAAGFNITESHAKKLYDAQKSLEIKTQILATERIQNAIVTVNSGEYSPFVVSQGVRDATAAVMLTVRGGDTLTKSESQAIAAIITGSVPGIKNENIAIIDSRLNHYPVGDADVDIGEEMSSRIALQNLLATQIRTQAEQILTPIFGMSNLQIIANVNLNFDKKTTESVEFFPPIPGEMDGIVRSSSELYEAQRSAFAAEGIPGTDSNAMGTVEYPYGTLEDGDKYTRAVIEKNYEINETRTIIEHEQGIIQSMGIAVSVNSDSIVEDYTTEVTNLISKGIGILPGNIAVESVRFSEHEKTWQQIQEEQEAYEAMMRRREMLQTIIKWAVILLLGLAFISLIRSIVKTAKGPEESEELLLADGAIDYLADDDLSEAIEMDEIELNTKSSALEQIERFIDKDPGAVAQLLRNWLTDE